MSIIDFFAYILLILTWLLYTANSFYLNLKMKKFLPNKSIEFLLIPFYIFVFAVFFITVHRLVLLFTSGLKITNGIFLPSFYLTESFYLVAIQFLGLLFCFLAISFFAYINFFEKSFPSCLVLKQGKVPNGIYKYIRHPSYYVFLFITFGSAFCLLNVPIFLLACINHICLYFYYMIEENQFKKNNPPYNEYLKNSNRFFPSLRILKN